MSKDYSARDIEVLSGLEPVRRRPGMYTDTSRPNHLAHEVIDNSVDEAIAGHCKRITVKVFRDGSMEVADDGRGMPVDVHPKEKLPGVELDPDPTYMPAANSPTRTIASPAACTAWAYLSSTPCPRTWRCGSGATAKSST